MATWWINILKIKSQPSLAANLFGWSSAFASGCWTRLPHQKFRAMVVISAIGMKSIWDKKQWKYSFLLLVSEIFVTSFLSSISVFELYGTHDLVSYSGAVRKVLSTGLFQYWIFMFGEICWWCASGQECCCECPSKSPQFMWEEWSNKRSSEGLSEESNVGSNQLAVKETTCSWRTAQFQVLQNRILLEMGMLPTSLAVEPSQLPWIGDIVCRCRAVKTPDVELSYSLDNALPSRSQPGLMTIWCGPQG